MLSRFLVVLTVLLGFALSASSVSAQGNREDELAIAGAMTAMDEFMLGFNARDPQAWAASLNYPHVRFASGSVTVWESAEEFAETSAFENLARDRLGSFTLAD